jgi:hypothetical protein
MKYCLLLFLARLYLQFLLHSLWLLWVLLVLSRSLTSECPRSSDGKRADNDSVRFTIS